MTAGTAQRSSGLSIDLRPVLIGSIALRGSLDIVASNLPINLGSVQLTPAAFLNLFVIACALLSFVHAGTVRIPKIALIAWSPFLAWSLFSALHSPVPVESLKVLINYFSYAAVFFIGVNASIFRDKRRGLLLFIFAAAIIPILFAPVQIAVFPYVSAPTRLMSTFGHPNILAFFLLIVVCYLTHIILSGQCTGSYKAVATGIAGASVLCILLTGTRSSWVSLYLFIFCYSLFVRPKIFLLVAILPPFALLIPFVHDRVQDVLFADAPNVDLNYMMEVASGQISDTLSVDSYTWRKILWEAAIGWFWQKPLVGFGLESFGYYTPQFFPITGEKGAAHNIFVQLLFEMGSIGFASYVFLVLIVTLALCLSRGLRLADKVFLVLFVVVFHVCAYSDNMLYYLSVCWYFWFILGVFIGLARTPTMPVRDQVPVYVRSSFPARVPRIPAQ